MAPTRHSAGLAAGVAILLLASGCSERDAAPATRPSGVVDTTFGAVQGEIRPDGAIFRGMPYGAPPTGDRRWRPTAPAAKWEGVRDATRFGPDCPQPSRDGAERAAPQSEDCLTLNVVTPDLQGRKLPVLVSIHGGAYFVGSGRYLAENAILAENGISSLVRRGVVLVAPNYRLGRLGFFAHPALRAETPEGPFANYWLTDEIAALEWVRDNIERFGGDPGNVTILGCSAGGSSVNALMATPAARGLFHKASVRSGGGFFNATRPLEIAEQQGIEFAARAGVTGTDAQALAALRGLSVAQVLAGDPGPPNFGAVIDGRLLPRQISASFAQGDLARVPLMVGSTSNEASVYGLMGFDREVLRQRFGIDLDAIRAAYEADGPLPEAELLRQVQTDFIFTSAVMGMGRLAARAGAPAYAYHFDYLPEGERGGKPGADHCADMPYLFGGLQTPTDEQQRLSTLLQDYLVNFMRTGDPNGAGLPAWPRLAADTIEPLVIGAADTRAVRGFRERQLRPWFDKWQSESGERLDEPAN